jgi:hypothetical protein
MLKYQWLPHVQHIFSALPLRGVATASFAAAASPGWRSGHVLSCTALATAPATIERHQPVISRPWAMTELPLPGSKTWEETVVW